MTYCVGIRLKQGIVGLADTRITSGTETTMSKKLYKYQGKKSAVFIMTSGLRSVRDKALTYFEEELDENSEHYNKMYKVVNALSQQIKRVASEDRESLMQSGLHFDIFTLVGGQMRDDKDTKLYLLYPQGNWIEIGEATPFMIIGNTGYGKPILSRSLTYDSDINFAMTTAILSFDSTRVCANDVGYPIDVFVYRPDTFEFIEKRYDQSDFHEISDTWQERLKKGISNIQKDFVTPLLTDFSKDL